MTEPKKWISEAEEYLKKLSATEETLIQLKRLHNEFKDKPFGEWLPNELSEMAGEMSVWLVNLNELVSHYVSLTNATYVYKKQRFSDRYRKLRDNFTTVKDTELAVEEEIFEEAKAHVQAQLIADNLKGFSDTLTTLVTTMQTRLKHIENDRVRTNTDDVMNY